MTGALQVFVHVSCQYMSHVTAWRATCLRPGRPALGGAAALTAVACGRCWPRRRAGDQGFAGTIWIYHLDVAVLISQARSTAAGRDQGSARESEFLPPQKHAPLPKNVNRLKSQQISAGFSTIQQGRRCTYSCTVVLEPVLDHLVCLDTAVWYYRYGTTGH